MNLLENFNLMQQLYERRGVWNHIRIFDSEDESRFVRKVYNYIRKEIVKQLNDDIIGNQIAMFDLSDNLLKRPNGKILKPLHIVYSVKYNYPVKMKVSLSDDMNNNSDLQLFIYTDLFDINFEVDLFHELKHWYQMSAQFSSFQDITALNCINDKTNSTKQEIRVLINLVNKLNPLEANAYCEQIYNEAYLQAISSINKHNVKDDYFNIADQYTLSTSRFDEIKQMFKTDEDIRRYIIMLFLTNVDEIVGKNHGGYVLFSNSLYRCEYVLRIREEIQDLIDTNKPINAYQYLKEKACQMMNDEKELSDEIISTFTRKLSTRRLNVRKQIGNVVYSAYDDSKDINNNEILRFNDDRLQRYLLIDENVDLEVEVLIDAYIVYITGSSLQDICRKVYILRCLLEEEYSVEFGYDVAFDELYDSYINRTLFPNEQKELDEYVEKLYSDDYNEVTDIVHKVNEFSLRNI